MFRKILYLTGLFLITNLCFGQTVLNKESLEKWREARFGMFIHWGPVTLKGTEIGWSRGSQVPMEEYDNLYKRFNPIGFNADEWVRVAKEAGMKYIVLTTKHHDGFCLWDTKQTDYNIMNSPFKRDVVKELSEACKKQGIAFGTYYSTCDWHHPDFPLTDAGGKTRKKVSNLDAYTDYLKRQIAELMLNYGPLFTLWFDVPQEFDAVRGKGIIDFAHIIQPDIVINSRTGAKGDYDTPEQRVGEIQMDRPWESCITIGKQWAWKPNEQLKSVKECVQTLILSASGDGNLLFNIGPSAEGIMEPEQVAILKKMGEWLKSNGTSIYGTRGGPFIPGKTISSTRKDSTIYLHTLISKGETVSIPAIPAKILSVKLMNGKKLTFKQSTNSTSIRLPLNCQDSISTTILLVLDKPAIEIPTIDLCENFIATASSFRNPKNRNNAPERLVDKSNDNLSSWQADAKDTTPWIVIDMRKMQVIKQVTFYANPDKRIKNFTLEQKNGNNWIPIFEGNEIGEKLECNFKKVKTQYIRINLTKCTSTPNIREIEIK